MMTFEGFNTGEFQEKEFGKYFTYRRLQTFGLLNMVSCMKLMYQMECALHE